MAACGPRAVGRLQPAGKFLRQSQRQSCLWVVAVDSISRYVVGTCTWTSFWRLKLGSFGVTGFWCITGIWCSKKSWRYEWIATKVWDCRSWNSGWLSENAWTEHKLPFFKGIRPFILWSHRAPFKGPLLRDIWSKKMTFSRATEIMGSLVIWFSWKSGDWMVWFISLLDWCVGNFDRANGFQHSELMQFDYLIFQQRFWHRGNNH